MDDFFTNPEYSKYFSKIKDFSDDATPVFDITTTKLDLSKRKLNELPDLSMCINLIELDISNNNITSIKNLPPSVEIINCSYNKIETLDDLHPNVKVLYCRNNNNLLI